MSRGLALTCLILFATGTLLASRPILAARPLGRDKSHAFALPRPKGRTRHDIVSSTEAAPALVSRRPASPSPQTRRPRDPAARRGPEGRIGLGLLADRTALVASPRLAIPLRC